MDEQNRRGDGKLMDILAGYKPAPYVHQDSPEAAQLRARGVTVEQLVEHVLARHEGWTREEISLGTNLETANIWHSALHELRFGQNGSDHDLEDVNVKP